MAFSGAPCVGQMVLFLTSADLFHLLTALKNHVDCSQEGKINCGILTISSIESFLVIKVIKWILNTRRQKIFWEKSIYVEFTKKDNLP